MATGNGIHFGHFVHQKRADAGKSLKEFGSIVGVGEKRMWAIEQMAEPTVSETTYHGLARAMGMHIDEFDKAWRNTKVRHPKKHKAGSRPHATRLIRVPAGAYERLERRARSLNRTVDEHVATLGMAEDHDEVQHLNQPLGLPVEGEAQAEKVAHAADK